MSNELNKMIKDIEICAKKKNKTNIMKCYELKLVEAINGKKDVFLRLKMEYEESINDGIFNTVMSTVSMIIAMLSLMIALSMESSPKLGIFGIVFILALTIYVILIGFYSLEHIWKKRKYKYIRVMLEDIDKNWDKYF